MLLYNTKTPTNFESYQNRGDTSGLDVGSSMIDTFFMEDRSDSSSRNLSREQNKDVRELHRVAPSYLGPKTVPQDNENAPQMLQDAWSATAAAQDAPHISDWAVVQENLAQLKEDFPDSNFRSMEEIDEAS